MVITKEVKIQNQQTIIKPQVIGPFIRISHNTSRRDMARTAKEEVFINQPISAVGVIIDLLPVARFSFGKPP